MATGITQQQVDAAASQHLAATGQHPSSRIVRELLGGTGSQTTIVRMLNDWKNRNPVKQAPQPTLPQSIANQLAAELLHVAVQARAPVEAEVAALQAELEMVLAANESLESDLSAVIQERDEAMKNTALDAIKFEQMIEASDELKKRIERETIAAENSRIEVAKAQLKIESLQEQDQRSQAQLKTLEQRLDEERKANTAAAQAAAVERSKTESAQAQKDALQRDLSELKKEAKEESKVSSDAHASALEKLRQEHLTALQSMQQRLDAAQSDATAAHASASQARERAASAEAKASAIQESLLIATQSANASKGANPPV